MDISEKGGIKMRVYGMNVLKELDKKKIKKVFTSRKEVCKYCSENKIKYEFVDNHLLNKMCEYNHQGVVIDAFDYDYYSLKDVEGNLVLILDHLEDPHNFGAIIRTCAAVGIKSIIIPKDRSVGVTDVVVKTSAASQIGQSLQELIKPGEIFHPATSFSFSPILSPEKKSMYGCIHTTFMLYLSTNSKSLRFSYKCPKVFGHFVFRSPFVLHFS